MFSTGHRLPDLLRWFARHTSEGPWIGLLLVLAAHVAVNVAWVAQEEAFRDYDPAAHVELQHHAAVAVDTLGFDGALALLRSETAQLWPSAGNLVWTALTAPLGHDLASLRLANLFYLAVMLLAVFAVGRRLHSPAAGLLAAALLSLYPGIYCESRQFGMDFPSAALAALGLWLMLRTEGFRRPGASLLFGVVSGFSLLVCPRTAFCYPLPALVGLTAALIHASREPRPWAARTLIAINMLVGAAAAALVSSVWWYGHAGALVRLFTRHQTGQGQIGAHPEEVTLAFYGHFLPWLVSPMLLAVAAVAAAGWWVSMRDRRPAGVGRPDRVATWMVAAMSLGHMAVLATMAVRQERYALPMLPGLAVLTAVGLCLIPHRRPRRALVSMALGVGALVWLVDSVGPWGPVHHGWPGTAHVTARFFNGSPPEQPGLSSGPPLRMPSVSVPLEIGRTIARMSADDPGGVVVRVAFADEAPHRYLFPVLGSALPWAQLGHLPFKQMLWRWNAEQFWVGDLRYTAFGESTSLPTPRRPGRSCYLVTGSAHGRPPARGPGRKVKQWSYLDPYRGIAGRFTYALWSPITCPSRPPGMLSRPHRESPPPSPPKAPDRDPAKPPPAIPPPPAHDPAAPPP